MVRFGMWCSTAFVTSRLHRSTQVKIASTDLWPQEMFTFSEMLALVESESSFGAYVCHRRPGGSTAISDLVKTLSFSSSSLQRATQQNEQTVTRNWKIFMPNFSPWLQSLCIHIIQFLVTVCSFCTVAPEENCTKSFQQCSFFFTVLYKFACTKNLFTFQIVYSDYVARSVNLVLHLIRSFLCDDILFYWMILVSD